jgi:hypothetical protein
MAKSSILGGESAPAHASGRGADLLGPSDSSDSGSDSQGELSRDALESDSDRAGTGDRASVNPRRSGAAADVRTDHIERVSGDALDAAESLDDSDADIANLAADEETDEDDAPE